MDEAWRAVSEADLERAQAAFPDLVVDRAAFARRLAEVVEADPETALAARRLGDLLLVFATEAEVPGAARAMEAVLGPVVARVHRAVRTGLSETELGQELRIHFFVERPGAPPRAREFHGKSSLDRWLHVSATRHALNLCRTQRRELPFEDAFFRAQPDLATPEVKLLEETYGAPVRHAVGRAMASLEERERAILWFSLVDGLPAERIARVYGVHRTSAARWIERALAELRRAVETELLQGDAGLHESELSSIVRAVLAQARDV